jgi:hypothetical protein
VSIRISAGLTETRRFAVWRPLVAALKSVDRLVVFTNWAIEGRQDSAAAALGAADEDQAAAGCYQAASTRAAQRPLGADTRARRAES